MATLTCKVIEEITLNNNAPLFCEIGFQFSNAFQSTSMFGVDNKNRSVFLNIAAGYHHDLFKEIRSL